ncbi:MAG: M23 family metallopeptidase, partial [Acidimicrobiales bacterium]
MKLGRAPRHTLLLTAVALIITVVGVVGLPAEPALAGPRPDFQLPATCGERWELKTYYGHNPDDKKLDMYRFGGTLGAPIRASAPGRVHQFFWPGGVEIDHGGGWFTVYLHMQNISVSLGQWVGQGHQIGEAGLVGTNASHLHYEQLYDYNGDGDGETNEMVHPVIQGVEYRLSPEGPFPVVTSTNACGPGDPPPPPPAPPPPGSTKYWVDTFATALGYESPTCVGSCGAEGELWAA